MFGLYLFLKHQVRILDAEPSSFETVKLLFDVLFFGAYSQSWAPRRSARASDVGELHLVALDRAAGGNGRPNMCHSAKCYQHASEVAGD
jgi:hypothetical protein